MKDINLVKFIADIKLRPAMFVASETIAELDGLLKGFIFARKSVADTDEDEIIREFSKWIREDKYEDMSSLNVSWRSVLMFYHVSETIAFNKFFELWEEFQYMKKNSKS